MTALRTIAGAFVVGLTGLLAGLAMIGIAAVWLAVWPVWAMVEGVRGMARRRAIQ